MRHYTVLFFSFKQGRLLPDEVCNVRLKLLAAQSGREKLFAITAAANFAAHKLGYEDGLRVLVHRLRTRPFQHSKDLGAAQAQQIDKRFCDSQFTFLIMHWSSSFMTSFDDLLPLYTFIT